MPIQPPIFGGGAKRKAWTPTPFGKDNRKRGRAGQRERAEVLAAEPLCRICREAGRTIAATRVDHKLPLSWGGTDDRENKQALCEPCHDLKSAAEREIDRKARHG